MKLLLQKWYPSQFRMRQHTNTYSNSLSLLSFLKKKIPDYHCFELQQICRGCLFAHYCCLLVMSLLQTLQEEV
jgi:hypothetical protein